jgi:hypothetical protein
VKVRDRWEERRRLVRNKDGKKKSGVSCTSPTVLVSLLLQERNAASCTCVFYNTAPHVTISEESRTVVWCSALASRTAPSASRARELLD